MQKDAYRFSPLTTTCLLGIFAVVMTACPSPPPPDKPAPKGDGFAELLGKAGANGEVNEEVTISTKSRPQPQPLNLPPEPLGIAQPIILEFEAETAAGNVFKGLLLSADPDVGEVDFSGPMQVRAQALDWNGVTVLRGMAAAPSTGGSSFVASHKWVFLAMASDSSLPVLAEPVAFDLQARAQVKLRCADNALYGAADFSRARSGAHMPAVAMVFLQGTQSCSDGWMEAEAPSYVEGQSVDTAFGTIFLGKGTLHWSNRPRPSALYFLGLPVTLPPSAINRGYTGEFAPEARMLSPFDRAQLREIRGGRTLVFDDSAPITRSIQPDDILVSKSTQGAENGFLRKVTGVQQQDGQLLVETDPASLDSLLRNGSFSVEEHLDYMDIVSIVPFDPGVDVQWPPDSTLAYKDLDVLPIPPIKIDALIFDSDGDHSSTDDQLRATGEVNLDATLKVDFDCRGFLCTQPYFLSKFTFTEDADLGISGDVVLHTEKKVGLYSMTFVPIWLGPVALTPKFAVDLTVDGNMNVHFSYRAVQSYSYSVGTKLEDGSWSPIQNVSQSFVDDPLEIDGDISVEGRVALSASLLLYGITGVGADIGAYLGLGAQHPGTPAWELYAGINSNIFVELDLIVWSDTWDTPLFDRRWTVAEAANMQPRILDISVNNMPFDGEITPYSYDGQTSVFHVDTWDAEDGFDCCTVEISTVRDGVIGSTNSPGSEDISYTFGQPRATRSVTVQLTDSAGAQRSKTFDVDILSAADAPAMLNDCLGFELSYSGVAQVQQPLIFDATVTRWGTPATSARNCSSFDTATQSFDVSWYVDNVFKEQDVFDAGNQSASLSVTFVSGGTHVVKALVSDAASGSLRTAQQKTLRVFSPSTGSDLPDSIELSLGVDSPSGGQSQRPTGMNAVGTGNEVTLGFEDPGPNPQDIDVVWTNEAGDSIGSGTASDTFTYSSNTEGWDAIHATATQASSGESKSYSSDIFFGDHSAGFARDQSAPPGPCSACTP